MKNLNVIVIVVCLCCFTLIGCFEQPSNTALLSVSDSLNTLIQGKWAWIYTTQSGWGHDTIFSQNSSNQTTIEISNKEKIKESLWETLSPDSSIVSEYYYQIVSHKADKSFLGTDTIYIIESQTKRVPNLSTTLLSGAIFSVGDTLVVKSTSTAHDQYIAFKKISINQ